MDSLAADALVAEDLAIRYADRTRGHRSGQFQGTDEYRRAREDCMASLFAGVAKQHGVGIDRVREAAARRDGRWDIIVVGLFTAVFAFAAGGVVRALCRRFPKDTGLAALVAVFVTSIAVSAAGVMMGELWSDALEILRIGNAHLSYRVSRIPWPQHRLALFLAGVGIIWLLSAWRYRMEKDA